MLCSPGLRVSGLLCKRIIINLNPWTEDTVNTQNPAQRVGLLLAHLPPQLLHGQPLHGLLHPEMGHLLVPTFDGDTFPGICPFHGRCLEGVASGTALRARTGQLAQELARDDPVWDLEAQYLAFGLLSIAAILSPERFGVGGGVASQLHLF